MKTYGLYLESGPRHRTTMVHVLDLLGCVATGPTTDDALAATPGAIDAFRRFLRDNGESAVEADAPFRTKVVEHITEGQWAGNGSPYLVFQPDLKPIAAKEIELLLQRHGALREALAAYAARATPKQLDAPRGGRTARAILLHVLQGPGDYLSPVTGGSRGYGSLRSAAERGDLPLADAVRRVAAMAAAQVRATTPEQRSAVIVRPKATRTLRKAIRRMLEHDWEHLVEVTDR